MLPSRSEVPTHCTVSLIGGTRSGQTALLERYVNGVYKERYRQTVGPDFHLKRDGDLWLELWDLTIVEGWRDHQSTTYRTSDAFCFIYDVTNRNSFNEVEKWIDEVKSKLHPDADPLCFMVGTKTDLVDERVVSEQEARAKAKSFNMMHYEVSAKNNEGVNKLFSDLSKALRIIKENEKPAWLKQLWSTQSDNRSFWQKHHKKIIGALVAAVVIAAIAVALWPLIVGLPIFGAVATAVSATSLVASQGVAVSATAVAATAVAVVGAAVSTFIGYLTDAVSKRIQEKKEEGISAPIIAKGSDTANIHQELGVSEKPAEQKEPTLDVAQDKPAPGRPRIIIAEPVPVASVRRARNR